MKITEANKYCTMMTEVKGRSHLIGTFGAPTTTGIPLPALVELCYLNFRKIIEVIAMGSLLANAAAFKTTHDRLKKYWNPKDLLRDISRLNPNFYPHPIVQKPSQQTGVNVEWSERGDDYLTQDRFITLYDICGGILHARNPFREEPDYAALLAEAPKWMTWIVNLLNAHTIRLKDDSGGGRPQPKFCRVCS